MIVLIDKLRAIVSNNIKLNEINFHIRGGVVND